jgi:hypothetical protein
MNEGFSVGESPVDPVKGVPIKDFFASVICNSQTSSFSCFQRGPGEMKEIQESGDLGHIGRDNRRHPRTVTIIFTPHFSNKPQLTIGCTFTDLGLKYSEILPKTLGLARP